MCVDSGSNSGVRDWTTEGFGGHKMQKYWVTIETLDDGTEERAWDCAPWDKRLIPGNTKWDRLSAQKREVQECKMWVFGVLQDLGMEQTYPWSLHLRDILEKHFYPALVEKLKEDACTVSDAEAEQGNGFAIGAEKTAYAVLERRLEALKARVTAVENECYDEQTRKLMEKHGV